MSDDVRSEPSRTGTRCPPPRKVHYPESNGLPIPHRTRCAFESSLPIAECVREEDVRAREMAERAIRQAQDGIAELEAQLEDPPAAPPAARRP